MPSHRVDYLTEMASTAFAHLVGWILRYILHFIVVACVPY
jgi:hypothetical protein